MKKKNNNKEHLKILIVDDSEVLRDSLKCFLKILPDFIFDIDEADSGDAAVEMVKENNFDFILMDYSMPPGITGAEATKLIKEIKPEVKILGASSYAVIYLVEDMINAGANGYLIKPFERHEITEAIKTVQAGGIYYSPEIREKMDAFNS